MHQYMLETSGLESSFPEKALKILIDSRKSIVSSFGA